jgi:hypothetical protein
VLWGITGLSGVESWALDDEATRATFRGLQGVEVIVEVDPDVERLGLTRQQLQADVELQLRQAGIRVLTHKERFTAPGQPSLYIVAQGLLPPSSLFATSFSSISLLQQATLDINTSSSGVVTWTSTTLATPLAFNLSQTIRKDTRDVVDKFINASLDANPRSAGSNVPSSASPWRDLIHKVQERLQIVGYNPGTIDGTLRTPDQECPTLVPERSRFAGHRGSR